MLAGKGRAGKKGIRCFIVLVAAEVAGHHLQLLGLEYGCRRFGGPNTTVIRRMKQQLSRGDFRNMYIPFERAVGFAFLILFAIATDKCSYLLGRIRGRFENIVGHERVPCRQTLEQSLMICTG